MSVTSPICGSCGAAGLELLLSLGRTPLANSLLTQEQLSQPEPSFPLDLSFCPHCTLVQITEVVPPEQMFSDYLYFSSFSDTMLRQSRALVERLIAQRSLNQNSLAAEIASNDGYLLQYYHQAGIPVLGIEPAANIAPVARERGIRTLCEFFGEPLAQQLSADGERADIIHANNVMAHVPDLNGVVQGIQLFLKDDGVAVIETPYVKDMIDRCEFDTIYHEHLYYYSLTALQKLFERHGLIIQDVERIPIHGGSLRVFAAQANRQPTARVQAMLDEEAAWGVHRVEFYQDFARRVDELKQSLRSLLLDLKQQGKRIAAYGAAAKGSTLLNTYGIGTDILEFVVDRSPHKQNRYMPGVHIPIYGPEKLLEAMPGFVLLLVWNFADEILEQQAEYCRRGGQFIIPIPQVRVV